MLEGFRLAEEALKAGWPLSYALVSEDALGNQRLQSVLAALQQQDTPTYTLPPGLFAQTADTEHSQGLLLIAQLPPAWQHQPLPAQCVPAQEHVMSWQEQVMPWQEQGKPWQEQGAPLQEQSMPWQGQGMPQLKQNMPLQAPVLPPGADFLLLADRLADPGNLGTIMRTAWAAGADALLLSSGCADPCSPKAARASMGAVLRLPLLRFDDEAALLALLQERGLALYAAAAGGQSSYDAARLDQPLVWLFGAEADGLSPFWRQAATHSVYLPMAQGAESLNVAAAAAVLLYATAASRGFPKA